MDKTFVFSKVPIEAVWHPVEPEIRLWRAVLDQAVRDALNTGPEYCGPKDRRGARIWFKGTSRDFWDVCYLACLEPTLVLSIVRRLAGGKEKLET